ncbi:UDP-glucose 4-epimerase [Paenibacillus sophorae]|uniref:UDP-glucose 4-epimerase n=1 Tax=Paenibacillus sophorae TaxID=1333845 RepID=A0A1H8RN26_9BACL|nr:UDP-glucose 4-epimerase GalE [Paenibacillus sophorae]QWU17051.1 UDP-glucose 4-epimerase GalE [Paenibacillus sophorae]SEO67780.1 UDP-glucose 4-epimerase [Paenibacillus sophorae]
MAILITGGAGYIGSHTAVELLEAGYEVVIVDNFANSHPEAIKRIGEITGKPFAFYELDLLDKEALDDVFARHAVEAVIHFAGLKAVGESVQIPLKYYHTNIMSTLSLCETMKKHEVFRIVFSSSATVYGAPESVPITEDFPIGATNPYGRTKEMIEHILRDVSVSDSRWGISILRYFNPIGAHKSGRIGEDPNSIPNNLLPYISQVAVGKLAKLSVFGDDYPTADGTGVRDYIHVVDLAQGHLKALERIMSRTGVDVYNLGTGRGLSVLEIVRAFEKVSGQAIPYQIAERRAGDIAVCYADTLKANEELGWQAARGIEEMCEDTWRWQSANPRGYAESELEPLK